MTLLPDEGYEPDRLVVKDENGERVPVVKNADGTYSYTEPDGGALLEAEFLEIIDNPFRDVKDEDYFHDPVLWAVRKGITEGTGEDTFSPDEPCTRAQVVTFLWRTAGCPAPTLTKNPFRDVSETDYAYPAILWAYEQGITEGDGEGLFGPDKPVTRGDSVTFLYRAMGAATAGTTPFRDVRNGDYFYDAVLWAFAEGVTDGTGEDTFSPFEPCRRGQIITFLYRAYHI